MTTPMELIPCHWPAWDDEPCDTISGMELDQAWDFAQDESWASEEAAHDDHGFMEENLCYIDHGNEHNMSLYLDQYGQRFDIGPYDPVPMVDYIPYRTVGAAIYFHMLGMDIDTNLNLHAYPSMSSRFMI